ncbi:MAG: bifunctional metallophosphatase/5'-nucleotidase [Deltaproteobacteria bacterium]|nr:bifunctional metallophosphatase/5'-nucleotidase [Deltaproteobacteria bacterium]
MLTRSRFSTLALLPLALAPACADDAVTGDSEEAAFLLNGKADGLGIDESGPEACAILKLASIGPKLLLDKDVKLDSRAAAHIQAFRIGADGEGDTDDDIRFTSLGQLDAVKWVGPVAFQKMLDYVEAHSAWACGQVAVQLLSFNDFHGALEKPQGSGGSIATAPSPTPPTPAGGAEYMAAHIKALRATNPNTLVVSAGDVIGATPLLSAAFHDEPTIESMDLMGLVISSVGNHEFDEGIDELLRIQYGGDHADAPPGGYAGRTWTGADFDYLAANVTYEGSDETIFPAYAVRRFGNARIAFIGMTLEGTPDVVTAAGVAGLDFADEAATANALVPLIKAQGIETIVVLLHEGGSTSALYNGCGTLAGALPPIVNAFDKEIDVVVAGHTNAAHVCDIGGILTTSAASNGRLLTDIDLVIDEATGEVVSKTGNNVIVTQDVAADPDQTALIAKWKAILGPIENAVVATIAGDIKRDQTLSLESALGNLIADAQLEASQGDGAVIAFMNPGGIRTDLTYAPSKSEQPGEVTYGELFNVQPFSNNLVVLDLTGAQIEQILELQWSNGANPPALRSRLAVLQISNGFTYAYSASAAPGSRVDPASIKLNGVTIDPTATYRVVANVFLAGGGDGFPPFAQGTNRVSGGDDLVALQAYLSTRPSFAPPALGRISVLP